MKLSAAFVASHLTGQSEEIVGADGSKTRRDTGMKTFWEAWGIVVGLGLVELVGHMIKADNDTAEIVHPYAVENGEADERAIATSAQAAAEALLTPGQIEWAQARDLRLLPVPAHQLPNVQLVGIARLRYRPHTKAQPLGSPGSGNGTSGASGIARWRSRPTRVPPIYNIKG
jgi:hypothetical protein